jgi:hypothetical protein
MEKINLEQREANILRRKEGKQRGINGDWQSCLCRHAKDVGDLLVI